MNTSCVSNRYTLARSQSSNFHIFSTSHPIPLISPSLLSFVSRCSSPRKSILLPLLYIRIYQFVKLIFLAPPLFLFSRTLPPWLHHLIIPSQLGTSSSDMFSTQKLHPRAPSSPTLATPLNHTFITLSALDMFSTQKLHPRAPSSPTLATPLSHTFITLSALDMFSTQKLHPRAPSSPTLATPLNHTFITLSALDNYVLSWPRTSILEPPPPLLPWLHHWTIPGTFISLLCNRFLRYVLKVLVEWTQFWSMSIGLIFLFRSDKISHSRENDIWSCYF